MRENTVNINDNCFDVIRLICTFTVFFGHFLTHFGVENAVLHEIAYFVRGVPVFFFLSGLFIARSLERYKTGEFFRKRAVRIFPELWVCVLLNLVIILASLGGGRLKDILVYLATQMTVFQFYTGSWLRAYGVGVPNGALWTITVDIQFYILAVFIVMLLKKKGIRAWLCTILGFMLLDLVLEKTSGHYPAMVYKLLQCNILPFLWIFLIGMAVYSFRDALIPHLVKLRFVIALVYVLWRYAVPSQFAQLFEGVRYNLVTTVLLLALAAAFGFSARLRLKHDYSYSFYLYHMVMINVLIQHGLTHFESTGQLVFWLLFLLVSISVLACLSQRLVADKLTRAIVARLR